MRISDISFVLAFSSLIERMCYQGLSSSFLRLPVALLKLNQLHFEHLDCRYWHASWLKQSLLQHCQVQLRGDHLLTSQEISMLDMLLLVCEGRLLQADFMPLIVVLHGAAMWQGTEPQKHLPLWGHEYWTHSNAFACSPNLAIGSIESAGMRSYASFLLTSRRHCTVSNMIHSLDQ